MTEKIFTHFFHPHLIFHRVEGDTFMMGGADEEAYRSHKPVHEVTVPTFYMGKYPVTQALWQAATNSNRWADNQTGMLKDMLWLTRENREDLAGIFEAVEKSADQQDSRLQGLLDQIGENLQRILPQLQPGTALANSVVQTTEVLKVKGDVKSKFKLAIPLLPGILALETEIAANPRDLFRKIWQDLRAGKVFTE